MTTTSNELPGAGYNPMRKGSETPEQLERQIEVTRSAIAQDVRDLGDKLSIEHLKEGARDSLRQAAGAARDRVSERVERVGHQIGAQAGPLALIGLGAGWLMFSSRHQTDRERFRPHGVTQRVREEYEETLRPRAEQLANEVREDVQKVRAEAERMSSEGRQRVSQSVERVRASANDNPLAYAGVAVLAGLGLGLILPTSRVEARALDKPVARIRVRAREVIDEGRDTARRLRGNAEEAVQEVKQALQP